MTAHQQTEHQQPHHESVHHIGSLFTYALIFGALLIGTGLTVWAAFQNIEVGGISLNAPIALIIATVKATLVVLYFMHVKDSSRLTKITVISGVFWLGILLTLTMTDFLTRAWH
ncbi:MAG: caa(3)-type oxidase, subunit [Acidobacteriales bacterium]|nr:caa(3)-type oxidase, subunit [Terriglobales bacterium]